MIFLDTHALIFLAADQRKIPEAVWSFLNQESLVYSPMVQLELSFLYEIGRIRIDPQALLHLVHHDHQVSLEQEGWVRAAELASTLGWTLDPFDRLITAHALTWSAPLLTKDAAILNNYSLAFWETAPVERG